MASSSVRGKLGGSFGSGGGAATTTADSGPVQRRTGTATLPGDAVGPQTNQDGGALGTFSVRQRDRFLSLSPTDRDRVLNQAENLRPRARQRFLDLQFGAR